MCSTFTAPYWTEWPSCALPVPDWKGYKAAVKELTFSALTPVKTFTSKPRQHDGFSTIFLCVSLFVSFHFSSRVTRPETSWTASGCSISLFFFFNMHWIFLFFSTAVNLIMIFFFWPPPLLLPLLLPLCCFFFFASLSFSQLMTTNTQMVSLSLSLFHVPLVSVSNFLFSAVTQPDTKPPIIRSPFISCLALSACCRHINCRLLCIDPPFARTMLI